MEHFCRVTMLGRATADPVRRPGAKKSVVAAFGFVYNDKYKGEDGWIDKPCWIDCEAFGDLAETVYKVVRKGFLLLVDGKLRFDEWKDKDNRVHRKHKLILTGCRVMDKPKPKAEPVKGAEGNGSGPAQSSEPEPI